MRRRFWQKAAPKILPPELCVKGRPKRPFPVPSAHAVLGTPLEPPFPDDTECVAFGMGCFWCYEPMFWETKGVFSTHVGYAQGVTKNPTYGDICTGETNHAEVVRVVYRPEEVSFLSLLEIFWTNHNPCTENMQRYDTGTQYRSGIYTTTEHQLNQAIKSKEEYQKALGDEKQIVTEIEPLKVFYYAEPDHQQYHVKPGARDYFGLDPLGVEMPKNWRSKL